MTSIKPPSSGTTSPHAVPERADSTGGSTQTERADSSAFQSALSEANRASEAGPAQQISSTSAAAADPVGQLAKAVESGAVSLDQAVDQLLGQTLERAGKHLTAAQRTELSELLRSALENDPVLAGLRH
jgi:hypothetical protein